MRARRVLGLTATLPLFVAPAASFAGSFDHLKCYKVKAGTRVSGVVDFTPADAGLPAELGCKAKGPSVLCVPVAKAVVQTTPPGPGAPAGPDETSHLCYKLRCPKPLPGALVASDQFGTFDLRPIGTSLVCTPAVLGTTTSTTTVTSTTIGGNCRTCWLSVSDLCTATPCTSNTDCQAQPNLLCLPDRCQVPCP